MSPRTHQQFQEIREEKKALIMDVALKHFAGEGYFNTTINHIAREAGISKGLMYNYFESKEELLKAIIARSLGEIYNYFDINRDGYLSEDEFEYFVRRATKALSENREFWRLFFQLLMQNEVRTRFLQDFLGTDSLLKSVPEPKKGLFLAEIISSITDYFIRKKGKYGPDYDPFIELNMFIITLKGFALTFIYMDKDDERFTEGTIEAIIKQYK